MFYNLLNIINSCFNVKSKVEIEFKLWVPNIEHYFLTCLLIYECVI